jgi:hypothetical protein
MNAYAYTGSNPVGDADPSGLIHVIIQIGPWGLGTAKVYADAGDFLGWEFVTNYVLFPEISPQGGELLQTFPVSNRAKNPGADPTKCGADGPFPDGAYTVDQVGQGKGMGPVWFHFAESPASARGTWLHSGHGEDWLVKTNGCIRGRQSDINELVREYKANSRLQSALHLHRTGARVTVTHVLYPLLP